MNQDTYSYSLLLRERQEWTSTQAQTLQKNNTVSVSVEKYWQAISYINQKITIFKASVKWIGSTFETTLRKKKRGQEAEERVRKEGAYLQHGGSFRRFELTARLYLSWLVWLGQIKSLSSDCSEIDKLESLTLCWDSLAWLQEICSLPSKITTKVNLALISTHQTLYSPFWGFHASIHIHLLPTYVTCASTCAK